MDPFWAKVIYLLGYWIANFAIRIPHIKRHGRTPVRSNHKTRADTAFFLMVGIGGFFLPLVYVFTPWLSFADYTIPLAVGLAGVAVLLFGDWLFWKAHHDLGANWSPVLEIRQEHRLITAGIYRRIRHPMYSSIWLLVIAQAMILPNYLAGFSGIIPFAILYFVRVGNEEKMMLDEFGPEYEQYLKRTGRLIPKF